jgi:hypothetical protein
MLILRSIELLVRSRDGDYTALSTTTTGTRDRAADRALAR